MLDQPAVLRQATAPSPADTDPDTYARAHAYDRMLESVRYEGAYPTRDKAHERIQRVMAALGRQVTGTARAELADKLPLEAALPFSSETPRTPARTAWGFVKDLAADSGVSPAVARWDTGAVLSAVARLAGPEVLARVLRDLPEGYALLFGQAELARPRGA
ncbi:DUF2267 domain-containing protein [Streptomyces sp. NPDC012888]|uniref:DUF2267 domain-containing protein n=1 Tax=Streptomyces sp. NPDC012888 TaxID=3364855 RepID=UPI0036BB58A5